MLAPADDVAEVGGDGPDRTLGDVGDDWVGWVTRSSTAENRLAFEPKFWRITGSVTPTRSAMAEIRQLSWVTAVSR